MSDKDPSGVSARSQCHDKRGFGRRSATPPDCALRSPTMPHPFFTIGHSTRTISESTSPLQSAQVGPRRGRQDDPALQSESQFNRETLPESLAIYQIAYAHMAELGGLRGRQRRAEPSPNAFWSNKASATTRIMRSLRASAGASNGCGTSAASGAAPSCAPRPVRRAATGASSRTI